MKRIAGMALVAAIAAAVPAQNKTAFWALEVNGQVTSIVRKIDQAEVSRTTIGGDLDRDGFPDYMRRHTPFQNITFQTQLLYDPVLLDLTQAMLTGKSKRNGALIAGDYEYKEKARVVMPSGFEMLSVTFPECDQMAELAATQWAIIGLEAAETGQKQGSGQPIKLDPRLQKQWNPSNFRLSWNEGGKRTWLPAIHIRPPIIVARTSGLDEDNDGISTPMFSFSDMEIVVPEPAMEVYKSTPWKHHDIQGLDAPTLELTYFDQNADGSETPLCTLVLQGLFTREGDGKPADGMKTRTVTFSPKWAACRR